jgi:hypothetical protein
LERKVQAAKKHSLERAQLEVDLQEHWDFQESFRDAYCDTIVKAISNKDVHLSFCLDAAGEWNIDLYLFI